MESHSEQSRLRAPLTILCVASALMLFFAAFQVRPYPFYQILRWLVCSTSILLSVAAYRWGNNWAPWLFAVTAILFNPIAPIHFARETWSIIDLIVAVVMLIGGLAVKPIPKTLLLILIALAPFMTGCNQQPDVTKDASNDSTVQTPDPIEVQLSRLTKAHSAMSFRDAGISSDVTLRTLEFQEAMDRLRGKSVGFVALLKDVYRAEDGFRAVFGAFEMGFDASYVLDITEKDARSLVELTHKDEYAFYVVVAQIESLKVQYNPARHVQGEKGDDPDSMDVEEFGLYINRVISGKLIAFEPDSENQN